ncbi:VWA domain-containing protein [Carboxydothermus pertinax]|uniref:VWFA domain-containing protein n=1 Tax=Carboxydothermus pertinax TaxID=870242 RepID=A0A1L8CW51_9THEO|nr:VWA domain-containing protein [Carboxydothermus pertinax]GAV23079.1 hypothetical protein cpu_15890 [Carboxydothermus pertinax]
MLKNLLFFVDVLRAQGFTISTTEVEDLIKSLSVITPQNKNELKAIFQATLVKNSTHKEKFEEVFGFFYEGDTPATFMPRNQEGKDEARRVNEALKEAGIYREIDFSFKEKEVLNSLPQEVLQKLYEKIDQFNPNQIVDSFPLLEKTIKGVLKYYRERGILPEAGTGGLRKDLFTANLKDLEERDYERVERIIKRFAGKLNAKASRRQKESKRKKFLNLRRTIRANLSHGGVLFCLKYREKRRSKPKLTVIIDVSASMAIYAKFIVSFLLALAKSLRKIELYLFAEDLEVFKAKNIGRSLRDINRFIAASQQWGRGTNLAQALKSFKNLAKTNRTYRQTLLIFSDGKTVQFEESLKELKQAERLYQELLFLNPVPAKRWQEDALLQKLAQEIKMLETNSIEHLKSVFAKVIF